MLKGLLPYKMQKREDHGECRKIGTHMRSQCHDSFGSVKEDEHTTIPECAKIY